MQIFDDFRPKIVKGAANYVLVTRPLGKLLPLFLRWLLPAMRRFHLYEKSVEWYRWKEQCEIGKAFTCTHSLEPRTLAGVPAPAVRGVVQQRRQLGISVCEPPHASHLGIFFRVLHGTKIIKYPISMKKLGFYFRVRHKKAWRIFSAPQPSRKTCQLDKFFL